MTYDGAVCRSSWRKSSFVPVEIVGRLGTGTIHAKLSAVPL
jgi:hypothetical protein